MGRSADRHQAAAGLLCLRCRTWPHTPRLTAPAAARSPASQPGRPASKLMAELDILAIYFDFGDTPADEGTEVKHASHTTLLAELLPGAARDILHRFPSVGAVPRGFV